jgi:hypothetical protein
MINIIFIFVLLAHAIAHLPGFISAYKIAELKELPYSTKIFFKKVEIGELGVKIYGLIWLILSIIFLIAVILLLLSRPVFKDTVLVASSLSLLISVAGLPETKFGVIINILLIVYLLVF